LRAILDLAQIHSPLDSAAAVNISMLHTLQPVTCSNHSDNFRQDNVASRKWTRMSIVMQIRFIQYGWAQTTASRRTVQCLAASAN